MFRRYENRKRNMSSARYKIKNHIKASLQEKRVNNEKQEKKERSAFEKKQEQEREAFNRSLKEKRQKAKNSAKKTLRMAANWDSRFGLFIRKFSELLEDAKDKKNARKLEMMWRQWKVMTSGYRKVILASGRRRYNNNGNYY